MITLDFEQIEARVRENGLPFAEILRRADIQYRTWYRWKTGEIDPVGNINKVLAEVEKLEWENKKENIMPKQVAYKAEIVERKDTLGSWGVEAINIEGDGECYLAIFSGPEAKGRAEEYARFKYPS